MNKRKRLDKEEARERRNRLIKTAAVAELSLIDGVREMRAISGMTQDEFARHRGVSSRVVKALELGQGNPTVATLNRIGEFFGLEVAFVPIRRPKVTTDKSAVASVLATEQSARSTEDPWHMVLSGSMRYGEDFLRGSATINSLEKWKGIESGIPDHSGMMGEVLKKLDQIGLFKEQLKKADILNERLKSVDVLNQQLIKAEALSQQLKKAELLSEQLRRTDALSDQLKKVESLSNQLKNFETLSAQLKKTELLTSKLKSIEDLNFQLEKAEILSNRLKKLKL